MYGTGCRLAGSAGAGSAGLETLARDFVAAHPEIFRARNEDLALDRVVRGAGKVGIHFAQTHRGLPVVGARVSLIATEAGHLAAFGSQFHAAIDLDPLPSLSAGAAQAVAEAALPFNPVVDEVIGLPELVVVPVSRFEGGASYRLAWRLRLATAEPYGVWLTHVDAHSGEVFWRENEVEFLYEGTSTGEVEIPGYCFGITPNAPFQQMTVTVSGIGSAETDTLGHFSIPGDEGPQTANAEFDGPWADVNRRDGPDASMSGPITPQTPLDLIWTDASSHVAERDAFYWTNETYAYIRRIDPAWTYAWKYAVNVNVDSFCNANWSINVMNFFREGGGCANSARIGDVIAHEFGHGVQFSLLGSQGEQGLGEGNADITSTLMTNDSVIGRGFFLNQCASGLRDCENTLRYPEDVIGQEEHDAGRVICGFHWDTWEALIASLGPEVGKAIVAEIWHYSRKLFRPMTQPDQVLAYFLTDDDDANLLNGTPHYSEICEGATNHGFSCPETVPVHITHTPLGDTQETQDPYPVVATIVAYAGELDPDSCLVQCRTYREAFSPFVPLLLTATGNPDEFAASIPAQPLGTLVQYYIQATNDMGGRMTHPRGAPGVVHCFFVGTLTVAVAADMETEGGWAEGPSSATRGVWERGDPVGIIKWVGGAPFQLQPEDDHTPDPGVQCWITGNGAGFPGDNSISHGGETTLESAVYNLAGMPYARLSFWLWYSNHLGNNPGEDPFVVELSNNGGTAWVTMAERLAATSESWEEVQLDLTNFVPSLTSAMRFRFIACDLGEASLVEAGVDDFSILVLPAPNAIGGTVPIAPRRFAIEQNRPNPFGPWTEIRYSVPRTTRVSLRVYDVDGRLVRKLTDRVAVAGEHTARWDGRDETGVPVASGIYYYRIDAAGFRASGKMVMAP
jgi:hypothetical protein